MYVYQNNTAKVDGLKQPLKAPKAERITATLEYTKTFFRKLERMISIKQSNHSTDWEKNIMTGKKHIINTFIQTLSYTEIKHA